MPVPLGDEELLDDRAGELEGRRVLVREFGEVRFEREGEAVGDAETAGVVREKVELVVAHETLGAVRVVAEVREARLLLWLAREDLHDATVGPVALATTAEGEPPAVGEPGVFLRPGVAVSIEGRSEDRLHVSLLTTWPSLAADGWVPAAQIGKVYEPADGKEDYTDSLADAVTIQSEPGGHGYGVAMTVATTFVRVVGQPQVVEGERWSEIVYDDGRVSARGFVPTAELDPGLGGGFGYGGGGGGYGASHMMHLALPAGSCLYSAVDGELIGKITSDTDGLGGRDENDAWWYLKLWTDWGVLDVWLRDEAAGDGEAIDGNNVVRPWARCD